LWRTLRLSVIADQPQTPILLQEREVIIGMAVPYELATVIRQEKTLDQSSHRRWASIVWIASGLWLYLTTPGAPVFSYSAAMFFAMGGCTAAIVVARLGYLARCTLVSVLNTIVDFPGPKMKVTFILLGWLLLASETLVGFQLAKTIFHCIAAA
jgi:hypothetical protein